MKILSPIFSLLLCSCGIATQASSIASLEHDLFYDLSVSEHVIAVDASGTAYFASANIDANVQPQLAAAFDNGQAPSYPLIGQDHANWVRSLAVATGSEDGKYLLTAKGLAPYPIRLSLIKRDAAGDALVASLNSDTWNQATHFATISVEIELRDGDVFVVRHEGAKQGFDSVVTVTLK
jgi:hypothetical protein